MTQTAALEKQEIKASENAIAVVEKGHVPAKPQPMTIREIQQWGQVFHESGMFPDVKSAAAAMVKIKAGEELGFGPFASMAGIDIIKGKTSIGSGLQASLIKDSPRYRYAVKTITDDNCTLEFYERTEKGWIVLGQSSFTKVDAKSAGLIEQNANYNKYGRNMLFSRALTNGMKWYSPDLLRACGNQSETHDDFDVDETIAETQTINGDTVDVATGEVIAEAPSETETPAADDSQPVAPQSPANDTPGMPVNVAKAVELSTKLQKEYGVDFESLSMQFLPEGVAKFSDLTDEQAAESVKGLSALLTTKVAEAREARK